MHIHFRRERPKSGPTKFRFGLGPLQPRPNAFRSLAPLERAHVANSPVRTSVALSDILDVRIGLQTNERQRKQQWRDRSVSKRG